MIHAFQIDKTALRSLEKDGEAIIFNVEPWHLNECLNSTIKTLHQCAEEWTQKNLWKIHFKKFKWYGLFK